MKVLKILVVLFAVFFVSNIGHAQATNSATFGWNAETQTVSGYNLYWGTTSGKYNSAINCGNVTTYTVNTLSVPGPIYVAITAYSSAIPASGTNSAIPQIESPYSAELVIYSLNVSSDSNSTISPSGIVWGVSGGSRTFTITPKTGYLSIVNVDGALVGIATSGSYTISNISTNHSISITSIAQIPVVNGLNLK